MFALVKLLMNFIIEHLKIQSSKDWRAYFWKICRKRYREDNKPKFKNIENIIKKWEYERQYREYEKKVSEYLKQYYDENKGSTTQSYLIKQKTISYRWPI